MNKHFLLTVSRITRETPEAICIEFAQPKIDRIQYKPGQYLTLVVPIDGEPYYRSYSMCSTPKIDDYIAVTVKRVEGGKVSNYLNDHLKEGVQLEVIEPSGKFYVENSVKFQRHIVLIGGGSGITPLFSIARAVLFNEPKSKVSLIYANRNEESIIFLQRLAELKKKFPNRFHVTHILSQPELDTTINHLRGRLDQSKLRNISQNFPSQIETHFYLCGPGKLMEMAHSTLIAQGIQENHIFSEKFVVDPAEATAIYEGDGKIREVSLHFSGEIYQLSVPSGTTVLEAGLSQNIPLPYSCRNGICSTCMAQLVKGEVDMPVREALLDFEIAAGKILLCQAHPKSDDISIEI